MINENKNIKEKYRVQNSCILLQHYIRCIGLKNLLSNVGRKKLNPNGGMDGTYKYWFSVVYMIYTVSHLGWPTGVFQNKSLTPNFLN